MTDDEIPPLFTKVLDKPPILNKFLSQRRDDVIYEEPLMVMISERDDHDHLISISF